MESDISDSNELILYRDMIILYILYKGLKLLLFRATLLFARTVRLFWIPIAERSV